MYAGPQFYLQNQNFGFHKQNFVPGSGMWITFHSVIQAKKRPITASFIAYGQSSCLSQVRVAALTTLGEH